MFIFNTTYVVSDRMHGQWMKWVREQHIPYVLKSGLLSHPQVAKVVGIAEQDGTSYSVQFKVNTIQDLEQWHLEFGSAFEMSFAQQFGTEVLFFATVLEIVE